FLYSNDSIQPTWRATLNLNYTHDWLGLHWDTSYIAGAKDFDDPTVIYGNYIPAYWYHNISAAFDLTSMVGDTDFVKGMNLIVGINNLADKDPPFVNGDGICKCNSLQAAPTTSSAGSSIPVSRSRTDWANRQRPRGHPRPRGLFLCLAKQGPPAHYNPTFADNPRGNSRTCHDRTKFLARRSEQSPSRA